MVEEEFQFTGESLWSVKSAAAGTNNKPVSAIQWFTERERKIERK